MSDIKSNKVKASVQNQQIELTESEWEIMKVIWEQEPCTAGQVQEVLSQTRSRAYSTIKTTMDRMTEKGLLQIKKVRNLQLFKSCISEVEAKRGEFRKMLKRAFDGAMTPMMQFLVDHEDLSKEEVSQLREIVKNANKRK